MDSDQYASRRDYFTAVLATLPPWDELLRVDGDERLRRGYGDTLREILQQPVTWSGSAAMGGRARRELADFVRRENDTALRPILLTGSGSSYHAAHCVAAVLQARLGVCARAVPASLLLTHPSSYVTVSDPPLVISFGRSGDSPESTAVLDLLLDRFPACRHIAITCNAEGRLATAYRSDARVVPIVLDPRTNDRSLVMTSSFSNMVIAGQALGFGDTYVERVFVAGRKSARAILGRHAAALAHVARQPFRTACYLASGAGVGAAHECALKMLEMTGGAVATMAETPLGLRHGPMAALRPDSLVVAGLPSSPQPRRFTLDVLHEIQRKRLAGWMIVVGGEIPADLAREPNVAVTLPLYDTENALAAVLEVVIGQILAFFRCMAEGLRPDAPSPQGVISRVVPQFPLY